MKVAEQRYFKAAILYVVQAIYFSPGDEIAMSVSYTKYPN